MWLVSSTRLPMGNCGGNGCYQPCNRDTPTCQCWLGPARGGAVPGLRASCGPGQGYGCPEGRKTGRPCWQRGTPGDVVLRHSAAEWPRWSRTPAGQQHRGLVPPWPAGHLCCRFRAGLLQAARLHAGQQQRGRPTRAVARTSSAPLAAHRNTALAGRLAAGCSLPPPGGRNAAFAASAPHRVPPPGGRTAALRQWISRAASPPLLLPIPKLTHTITKSSRLKRLLRSWIPTVNLALPTSGSRSPLSLLQAKQPHFPQLFLNFIRSNINQQLRRNSGRKTQADCFARQCPFLVSAIAYLMFCIWFCFQFTLFN